MGAFSSIERLSMIRPALLLAAALTALAAAPGVAAAQWADPGCVRSNHDSRVEGTVLGALGGALAGDLLGGRHGHGLGAGLGALGGAAVGNSWAGARNDPCPAYAPPPPPPPRYGYGYGYSAYAPPPPPPAPDDGLMAWAGRLEGRVARDRDAGLLTNRQARALDGRLEGTRQRYHDLRWRDGGYLGPEEAGELHADLGDIDAHLRELEYQGS